MSKPKTPEDLNRINTEFWAKKNTEFAKLIEQYPHDLAEAVDRANRLISAGHMHNPAFLEETSLEAQIQKAKDRRAKNNSVHAKKPRVDALQAEIEKIVSHKPTITRDELFTQLEQLKGLGIIQDIEDDLIHFSSSENEPVKTATISGLKDRLSRARKKISKL
jgi:hypothetical protein